MSYEYECAISGVKASGSVQTDDELEDLPPGWTRITIQRRLPNPNYIILQQVKEAVVNGQLMQIPEEHREAQRPYAQVQVDAAFYGMESDTPPFITDVQDVVYASENSDVNEVLNEVRAQLGLEAVPDYESVQQEIYAQAETPEES